MAIADPTTVIVRESGRSSNHRPFDGISMSGVTGCPAFAWHDNSRDRDEPLFIPSIALHATMATIALLASDAKAVGRDQARSWRGGTEIAVAWRINQRFTISMAAPGAFGYYPFDAAG